MSSTIINTMLGRLGSGGAEPSEPPGSKSSNNVTEQIVRTDMEVYLTGSVAGQTGARPLQGPPKQAASL